MNPTSITSQVSLGESLQPFEWTRTKLVLVLTHIITILIQNEHPNMESPQPNEYKDFYCNERDHDVLIFMGKLVDVVNEPIKTFAGMLIFLNRAAANCDKLSLNYNNWKRLVATCMIVAMRWKNIYVTEYEELSRILKMDLQLFQHLEIQLLFALGLEFSIPNETYEKYMEYMISLAKPVKKFRQLEN